MDREEVELGEEEVNGKDEGSSKGSDNYVQDSFARMTPAQRKFMELKAKINDCRKRNHTEVVEEDKRAHEQPQSAYQRRKEWQDKRSASAREAEASAGGDKDKTDKKDEKEDPSKRWLSSLTAEEAEVMEKKKKKPKRQSFGWEMYTEESQRNMYKRRTKELDNPEMKAEYEHQKAADPSSMFKAEDDLTYGTTPNIPKQNIERMVSELERTIDKRTKYSRRRGTNPDADITYINERNKIFNKKISRAFDPYTVEIRQNLERGTAL